MKWLIGSVAAAVILIIAAVVIIPMVVDPNDYKDEIVAAAKKATGRDLGIRDDMELEVFPNLAIRLGGVTLSNANGFEAENMAAVEEVDLRVALMPLLSRSLEVDTVVIRGLELNLAVAKDGRTNWEDLAGDGAKKDAAEPADKSAAQDVAIQVQGIKVADARLVWDDKKGGKHYELAGLNFETGKIEIGEAIPVSLGFTLTSAAPAQTFEVTLNSDITANEDMNRFDLAGLVATLAAAGEGLPGGGLEIGLKSDISLDNAAGTVAVSNLVLTGPDLELSGNLDGKGLNKDPAFSGAFKLAESNLKQLMALGGSVPVTADPAALTRVSAEFGVAASATSAALKPFAVNLDDSKFTGDFTVKSFDGPALRFALQLDQIDVDRYLPPKSDEETPTETAQAPASEDPLAALRPLDLAGTVNIGALKIANLNTTNIAITLKSAGGVLDINPIAAALYDGKVGGSIRVDASKPTPRIAIKNALQNIQINPLLKDFSDNEKLAGSGNVDVDLQMQGLDPERIKQSLNGRVAVSLNDGVYKGIDVIKTICSVGTKLDSLLSGATGELNQSGDTAFSAMSTSVNFVNGVASSDDLDVKSPLLRVTGGGGADLNKETLDYLVNAELVSACEGQSGAAADQLVGVPLPIRAKGTFSEPKISPDWATLGAELAKSGVKDKAQNLLKDTLKIPGLGAATGEAAGETAGEAAGSTTKDVGGALKDGLKKLF